MDAVDETSALRTLINAVDRAIFDVRTLRAERLDREYPNGHELRDSKVPMWARKHLTLCSPGCCVCGGGATGVLGEERGQPDDQVSGGS